MEELPLLNPRSKIMTDMRELTAAEIGSVGGGWGTRNKNVVIAKDDGTNNIGNLVAGFQKNGPFSFAGATFVFYD
jgi:hypothetical protein